MYFEFVECAGCRLVVDELEELDELTGFEIAFLIIIKVLIHIMVR